MTDLHVGGWGRGQEGAARCLLVHFPRLKLTTWTPLACAALVRQLSRSAPLAFSLLWPRFIRSTPVLHCRGVESHQPSPIEEASVFLPGSC